MRTTAAAVAALGGFPERKHKTIQIYIMFSVTGGLCVCMFVCVLALCTLARGHGQQLAHGLQTY